MCSTTATTVLLQGLLLGMLRLLQLRMLLLGKLLGVLLLLLL